MPKQQTNTNTTFTEQVMNWFHEVNGLYDGTLNKIHHFFYSTDITTNDTFTLSEAMKQEDRLLFVDTMYKGIHDNEEGGHWTVDHCNNLPPKAHPIKSIWSFKRKHKPDGQLLKHKFRLCAHGGMKQYCALRSAGWACGRADLPANSIYVGLITQKISTISPFYLYYYFIILTYWFTRTFF